MTEYKLSGDEAEVAKIIRENKIRVERGLVTFAPCSAMEPDGKSILVIDDKSVPSAESGAPATDDKKPKPNKKKKSE